MKAADVGRRFLDYFESKGHTIVPSASLLYNDPTLLFVNAGMVPFKAYYTGEEAAPYARAASVQKCVRTLDIEEVGRTTRHGTFFQMNGNFAFGDYFKAEAIEYAWELVTTEQHHGGYGFDPDKVWVTALHGDEETVDMWRKVGVPSEHIQMRGLKDNYWHMGIPGPGGPCSEIYIDRGPEFGPDGGPEADEDRFLEIWNLVFQTEELSAVRAKDDFDVLRPLPSKNIDTGMGLERVAYLLQGVGNMYETDQVFPVIARAGEMAGRTYGADPEDDVRLRVVGDHIRSSLMLMTDGVNPGNEARGYVLRRLLRRSVRAMRLMGVHDPVIGELLGISRDLMHDSYPDIDTQWDRVLSVATAEEESFRRTLTQGSQLFDTAVKQVREQKLSTVSGEQAFQLHDTYGFPIDLTLEMAEEQGLSVDRERFVELMNEQRTRAKADAKSKKTAGVSTEVFRELRDQGETPFLGYTELSVPTRVRGIIHEGKLVDHAPAGAVVEVVLDETPFYAESGGQDADIGTLEAGGFALDVVDVQRPVPGLVVHSVEATGDLVVGDEVLAQVDGANRVAASQAHTATHIIHAALRELVGKNATQAGSYNKPGYLRFDFSAQHGLSDALKSEIEERANIAIRDNFEVTDTQMKLDEAKALGAMAMFGEKYPPVVRMVELAGPWSRELCGGTHVTRTSEIGMLTLLGEQSIGSGTRRVEALVSGDAFNHLAGERALVSGLASILKVQPDQLSDRVEKLVAQLKDAERQIADLKAQQLAASAGEIIDSARTVGPVLLVGKHLEGVAAGDLRTLATDLRGRIADRAAVIALVGGTTEKPAIVVATTQAARDAGIKAGALVGLAAPLLGGKGGGKDDLAQGGGTDASGAQPALAVIESDLAAR
ncbi:alanine--tRNA ligase [Tessaracoccus sp. SD287]|uniref:alanine--tRNA ligase n=1 Tax=Tessaracoccus sp. SD287 TaxID=2782008 RepID=UPI001A967CDB|nr:alanine--tRNA ligase [Tessaracoccus sp. SD287]MBO1030155.1 alanine--tRNA ligase [Tessaracoccus sp. SD287]